jgi:hypothetical protein
LPLATSTTKQYLCIQSSTYWLTFYNNKPENSQKELYF